MIAHIVLFRPHPNLSDADALALGASLDRALQAIGAIRRARVGRRLTLGVEYEKLPQPDFPFAAVIEFDDRAGLESYLNHPAHAQLAQQFWDATEATLVYDFDTADSAVPFVTGQ